jgi:hypothetical protein
MCRFVAVLCAAIAVLGPGIPVNAQSIPADFGLRLLPLSARMTSDDAQSPATPGQVAPLPKLFIQVIDGEGAVNNIKARTAREPVVEVDDQNHKPVAGALVTFFVSNQGGAGASFGNQQTLTLMTDASGRARAQGFHTNGQSGNYAIEVTATYAGQIAKMLISETNASGSSSGNSSSISTKHIGVFSGKGLLIIGAVAAATTFGVVYAVTRDNTPTATIGTGGTVTVGATH